MKKLAVLLGFFAIILIAPQLYAADAEFDAESNQIQVYDQSMNLQNRPEVDGLTINKDVDDLFNKETQTIAAPVQVGFFDHKEFQRLMRTPGAIIDVGELVESKGMEQDGESLQLQQINTKTETGSDCNQISAAGANAVLSQGYEVEQSAFGSGYIGYQAGTSQSTAASSVTSVTETSAQ